MVSTTEKKKGIMKKIRTMEGFFWAWHFFAFGLFSTGLSSAITAPLAAAYATSGALGRKDSENMLTVG